MRAARAATRPATLWSAIFASGSSSSSRSRGRSPVEARVLIMDEPTSALSGNEVEVLFEIIRELTAAGVAIVYISHHLEEALEIADHAVVFRDGVARRVGRPRRHRHQLGHLATWSAAAPSGLDTELRRRLRTRCLSLSRRHRRPIRRNPQRLAVDGVSLDVRAGEIVCLYGLMGAGRTELLEALAGRLPIRPGSVTLNGRAAHDRVGRRADPARHGARSGGPSTRRSRPDHVGRRELSLASLALRPWSVHRCRDRASAGCRIGRSRTCVSRRQAPAPPSPPCRGATSRRS